LALSTLNPVKRATQDDEIKRLQAERQQALADKDAYEDLAYDLPRL
jgi:hypothetical protein